MSESPETLFEKVAGARREWMACFDAITDWVFVKAPDLRIVKANKAAAALFSRIPQQLIGHTCQSLFGCEDAPADEALVLQTFQSGQSQSADVSNMPVWGEFHITTYPLMDEMGRVEGVIEFVRDITEQKAMQRQLLQSARLAAIGELAAGVAHNFGNILMGVGGSLEVLLLTARREGFTPKTVERMEIMHRELMRGDNIVKRLLSFARGSAPSIRAVKAAEVMEGVVSLCQAHPVSRGIAVTWKVAGSTPAMQADPAQLREVLTNLVLNALQATPKGGKVVLLAHTARPDAAKEAAVLLSRPANVVRTLSAGASLSNRPYVDLVVADSGCGVADEDLPRLFTPFFSKRVDGSQGTGLGLCVSLGIIQGMGGRISVATVLGHGTVFTVTLPAKE